MRKNKKNLLFKGTSIILISSIFLGISNVEAQNLTTSSTNQIVNSDIKRLNIYDLWTYKWHSTLFKGIYYNLKSLREDLNNKKLRADIYIKKLDSIYSIMEKISSKEEYLLENVYKELVKISKQLNIKTDLHIYRYQYMNDRLNNKNKAFLKEIKNKLEKIQELVELKKEQNPEIIKKEQISAFNRYKNLIIEIYNNTVASWKQAIKHKYNLDLSKITTNWVKNIQFAISSKNMNLLTKEQQYELKKLQKELVWKLSNFSITNWYYKDPNKKIEISLYDKYHTLYMKKAEEQQKELKNDLLLWKITTEEDGLKRVEEYIKEYNNIIPKEDLNKIKYWRSHSFPIFVKNIKVGLVDKVKKWFNPNYSNDTKTNFIYNKEEKEFIDLKNEYIELFQRYISNLDSFLKLKAPNKVIEWKISFVLNAIKDTSQLSYDKKLEEYKESQKRVIAKMKEHYLQIANEKISKWRDSNTNQWIDLYLKYRKIINDTFGKDYYEIKNKINKSNITKEDLNLINTKYIPNIENILKNKDIENLDSNEQNKLKILVSHYIAFYKHVYDTWFPQIKYISGNNDSYEDNNISNTNSSIDNNTGKLYSNLRNKIDTLVAKVDYKTKVLVQKKWLKNITQKDLDITIKEQISTIKKIIEVEDFKKLSNFQKWLLKNAVFKATSQLGAKYNFWLWKISENWNVFIAEKVYQEYKLQLNRTFSEFYFKFRSNVSKNIYSIKKEDISIIVEKYIPKLAKILDTEDFKKLDSQKQKNLKDIQKEFIGKFENEYEKWKVKLDNIHNIKEDNSIKKETNSLIESISISNKSNKIREDKISKLIEKYNYIYNELAITSKIAKKESSGFTYYSLKLDLERKILTDNKRYPTIKDKIEALWATNIIFKKIMIDEENKGYYKKLTSMKNLFKSKLWNRLEKISVEKLYMIDLKIRDIIKKYMNKNPKDNPTLLKILALKELIEDNIYNKYNTLY